MKQQILKFVRDYFDWMHIEIKVYAVKLLIIHFKVVRSRISL